jgi:hypothetical protein
MIKMREMLCRTLTFERLKDFTASAGSISFLVTLLQRVLGVWLLVLHSR